MIPSYLLHDTDHQGETQMANGLNSGQSMTGARGAIGIAVLLAVCLVVSYVLATQNVFYVAATVIAALLFAVGFLSLRVALYILIFSMLLSPEIGMRDLTGKGFTLRFEDLLLIVMGFAWLVKSSVYKEVGLVVQTRLNRPIALYITACTIATMVGYIGGYVNSPVTGFLFVLKYFEYFVVFFITLNIVRTREDLRNLLVALFITYGIILVIGFLQIPQGERISAPFEGETTEPNTLGGYLLIMLCLNIAFAFYAKRPAHRALLGGLAVMCMVAILYTLSRATWLALVPTMFLLTALVPRRGVLILAILVGLVFSPFFLPRIVIERITYTINPPPESPFPSGIHPMLDPEAQRAFDSSTEARLSSMGQALSDFVKRPLFGYGITGYDFIDAQYHRVLIETGIVGLTAFLWLLWVTGTSLYGLWKDYHGDPLYAALITGTFCAFIGLVVHSVGTNSFIIVRIMEPFWALMGMNMAIPIIERKGLGTGIHDEYPIEV